MKALFIICCITLLLSHFELSAQKKMHSKPVASLALGYYSRLPVYIINKNYVVYERDKTRKIIYADVASFRIPESPSGTGMAIDKNGVYFNGKLIKIDTTGFEIVGEINSYGNYTYLWKTAHKVFKDTIELHGIDARTFEPISCINGGYFRDKKFLYYFTKKIENSSPSTVNITCDTTCYDENNVYAGDQIMYYKNQKLRPVNEVISKTVTKAIYQFDQIVPYMDAKSLKGLSRKYSIDKNHVYWDTIASPILPENFKNVKVWDQVNRSYVSDGIKVYSFASVPEPDFDAGSFGMLPHSDFCYDKNGVYERHGFTQENKIINRKFPFNYTIPVTPENTSITDNNAYIIYDHQAYDPGEGQLFVDLTDVQIDELKAGRYFVPGTKEIASKMFDDRSFLRAGDKLFYILSGKWSEMKNIDLQSLVFIDYTHFKDKGHVYFINDQGETAILPNADPATFKYLFSWFYADKSTIYFKDRSFMKSRGVQLLAVYISLSGDEGEPFSSNYYLFKNSRGFWLVEMLNNWQQTIYLGKHFDPKWNKAFENFELPKGL